MGIFSHHRSLTRPKYTSAFGMLCKFVSKGKFKNLENDTSGTYALYTNKTINKRAITTPMHVA